MALSGKIMKNEPQSILKTGKLPPEALNTLISRLPVDDPSILAGPAVGMDCAVIELGQQLLVAKTDPITFAADEIGWYAVQITANDLATTGATPRWLLVTALLPEGQSTPNLAYQIADQIRSACEPLGIHVAGGHTEITSGLDRPILSLTLLGTCDKNRLVLPTGIQVGDDLILTKTIALEGTAILAREFRKTLSGTFSPAELDQAANFIYTPGIGVSLDARTALANGRVHAMHDPTEGGLAAALNEMAYAGQVKLRVEARAVPIASISKRICEFFDLDPWATISSGALLLACPPEETEKIITGLSAASITAARIGSVSAGSGVEVIDGDTGRLLPTPERDEIARILEERPPFMVK